MRNWLYGVLGLVLGIGLFVGGVSSMPGGTVKCGERVMSPGDTCTTLRKGRATHRSYDEQKSKDGREAIIMMIVGPLLAVGCGVLFLGPAVKRRRKGTAHAAGPAAGPAYGGPPPGYPPGPGGYGGAPPGYPPGPAYGGTEAGYPPARPPAPNARPADLPPPPGGPYPPPNR
ncbi:hypothetical protein [Actinomadura nitritigenes]|uniref:hypothetical protein n=1 Tax=Actinomadura nitritigenes TaxID=134602 RepID=UPI003D8C1015